MAGLVVVGAGGGIGASVAARFAKEGLPVGLIARSRKSLAYVQQRLSGLGSTVATVRADVTDDDGLRAALGTIADIIGSPDILVYNAALIRSDVVGELSIADHQSAWAVNVAGAINTAALVVPAMQARGAGTFIITGGMPKVDERHVSLSLGKAGVRAFVDVLDKQYRDAGVHAASVTIAGPVAPGTPFDPDVIAEHYWDLHNQAPGEWATEIVHAGSA